MAAGECREVAFAESAALDRELWDERGGLIRRAGAEIAERDQDHVPEVKVLTALGMFAVPVTAETTIGEIQQRVQEWKPEYSLEQIELVCKETLSPGGTWRRRLRPRARRGAEDSKAYAPPLPLEAPRVGVLPGAPSPPMRQIVDPDAVAMAAAALQAAEEARDEAAARAQHHAERADVAERALVEAEDRATREADRIASYKRQIAASMKAQQEAEERAARAEEALLLREQEMESAEEEEEEAAAADAHALVPFSPAPAAPATVAALAAPAAAAALAAALAAVAPDPLALELPMGAALEGLSLPAHPPLLDPGAGAVRGKELVALMDLPRSASGSRRPKQPRSRSGGGEGSGQEVGSPRECTASRRSLAEVRDAFAEEGALGGSPTKRMRRFYKSLE